MPSAFTQGFSGPEGPYTVRFEPTGTWDGIIDVTINGVGMHWAVDEAHSEGEGRIVLSGMTRGSEPLWNDQYWFELRFEDWPPIIRYWGDRVVVREDQAE